MNAVEDFPPPDERIWTASVPECPVGRTGCISYDAFSLS